MAVAAAIGVGSEETSTASMTSGHPMSNRLLNKRSGVLMPPGVNPALGEINRSIEKMSIGGPSSSMGRSSGMPAASGAALPASGGGYQGGTAGQTNLTTAYGHRRGVPAAASVVLCF